ncbi:MAG TPA: hypothetical protein PKV71_12740, partial [Calditrichia bacterium]|nr:hypothetical protein [Calditrichia bacterium]
PLVLDSVRFFSSSLRRLFISMDFPWNLGIGGQAPSPRHQLPNGIFRINGTRVKKNGLAALCRKKPKVLN